MSSSLPSTLLDELDDAKIHQSLYTPAEDRSDQDGTDSNDVLGSLLSWMEAKKEYDEKIDIIYKHAKRH